MSDGVMTNMVFDFGVEEIANVSQMQGLLAVNRIVFNSNYGFMWPAPNMDFIVRCAYAERAADSRSMTRAEAVVWYPLPPALTMLVAYIFGGGAPQGVPGGIPGGIPGDLPSGLDPSEPHAPQEPQAIRRTWRQLGRDVFLALTQRRSLVFGIDFGIKKDEGSLDLFDNSNVLPDWRHALHQTGIQFGARKILYKENALFTGPPQGDDDEDHSIERNAEAAQLTDPTQPTQQSFYQLQLNFTLAHKQLEKARSIWASTEATGPGSRGRAKLASTPFEQVEEEDDEAEGESNEAEDPETAFYADLKRTRPSVAFSFTNSAITHSSQLNFLAEIELAKDIDVTSKLRLQSETILQPSERVRLESSFQLELVKALQKGQAPPPVQDPATGQDLQEYLASGKNVFSETIRASRQFSEHSVSTIFTQIFSQSAELSSLVNETKYMIGLEHQHFTPIGETKTSIFIPFFDPQSGPSFQVELRVGAYLPTQDELEAMMRAESEERGLPAEPVVQEPQPQPTDEPTTPAPKKKWFSFGKKADSEESSTSKITTTQLSSSSPSLIDAQLLSKLQSKTKLSQISEELVNRVLNENETVTHTMPSRIFTSPITTTNTTVREKVNEIQARLVQYRRTANNLFNWSQRRFGFWNPFRNNWTRNFSGNHFIRLLPTSQHMNTFSHQY